MNDMPAASPSVPRPSQLPPHRAGSDVPFFLVMGGLGGSYVLLVVVLLGGMFAYTPPQQFVDSLNKPEIRHAIWLTLVSCSISALLSIWVATPLGYLMSRFN